MSKYIVSELWIYPVKSLGGIRLSSAHVLPKGLEHDRRWMLIDEQAQFITQRVYPQMALFKVTMPGQRFQIHHSGQSIELPVQENGDTLNAVIWDDEVEVYEASKYHSEWFSEKMGINCRLVCFPENNQRPVDPRYASGQEQVSLADGYPLLIIGQSSLDDLNQRLAEPVPMNRFRPNIVFTGGQPYEEDQWSLFTIGRNRFSGVKPCARCVLTTVNQDTAVRGKEPLATMADYRRRNGKVYFGQNLLPIDHTLIREGDEILLS